MKKYLLFDLDGTLTDPKVGICTCVQYALASFGIEEPDIEKLTPFIGPPLKDSFQEFYGFTDEQAAAAIEKYRERFQDVGLFENEIYAGVPEMLKSLNAKGMFLAVASSKPTVFVKRILEHFDIAKYFKVVVGSELDGTRTSKDEVVEEALRQLFGDQPVDKSAVYMIGDRKFDIEGAKAMGVESVGVSYGYGGMEELREAKADYIVRSVEELQRFLLRGTEESAGKGLTFQKIWQFGYPFLMFLLIRSIAVGIVAYLYLLIDGHFPGTGLLIYDEAGNPAGTTGNGSAIAQIIGFVAGAAVVWKSARKMIREAAEDAKLLHIRKEPAQSYLFLTVASVGMMLGLNMLMELTGMTNISAAYQRVSEQQYSAGLIPSLLLYVAAAPVAEELLFRGVIYNCFKRTLKPAAAMLAAAVFFGVYHGNSVQGIYGFCMACLIIYAYEYFGDFRVPVIMHALINLISYLLCNTELAVSGFVCWPVCIISLAVGAGAVLLMRRQRKVF